MLVKELVRQRQDEVAMAGADVTLCARNLDSLQKVANEIEEHTTGRIVIKTIDLEDLSMIDKLIDEIITNSDLFIS